MSEIHILSQNDLTRTLAARHGEMWDAYVRIDEDSHNQFMTEDFRAVHPDGSLHIGRPTAAEIAAEPIEDYWLADMQAWPVGEEAAIVTYTAEVEVRTPALSGRFQFAVGEVWVLRDNEWKCRYYHATMLKS